MIKNLIVFLGKSDIINLLFTKFYSFTFLYFHIIVREGGDFVRTRNYLTTLLSLISIIPIVLVMLFSIVYFERNSAQGLQTNMESTARLTADNINQFFSQRKMALEVASDLSDVKKLLLDSNMGVAGIQYDAERSNVVQTFKTMTEKQTINGEGNPKGNYVRRSSLVNSMGQIIVSDDVRLIGQPSFLKVDMRTVPAYEFYVSDLMQDASFIDGQKFFEIAVPIYQDGVYQGFIQSSIDMYYFDLLSKQTFMNTGRTAVIDNVGNIAGSDPRDELGNSVSNIKQVAFDDSFYSDTWRNIDFKKNPSGLLDFREGGKEKSAYYSSISGTDWVIMSMVSRSELVDPIKNIAVYYVGALLLFALILVYISYSSAKRFLNPTRDMCAAFVHVKQRDYSVRLPENYKGEFGEMAFSFNHLVEKIKEDTEELKVSEARYALIMEETNQVIFEWDILQNHLYHTVHWTNKFGFTLSVENPGSEIPDFAPVHPDDRPLMNAFFWNARRGIQPKPVDVRMKTINSKYVWCTVSVKVINDETGRPFRAIGLVSDTDHQKKMIEKLESKSKTDLLTQLYNKVTTEAMIEEYLSSSPPEERHGFIIVDIDNFKGINDTLGHIYGDDVLKRVSAQIKDLFRATDIVGRAGGDEFVILVKDMPDEDLLKIKLSDICAVFHNAYTGDNAEYKISASVGAAVFPNDGTTFSELYQHADAALYRSKNAGKDRFCLYCEGQLKHLS